MNDDEHPPAKQTLDLARDAVSGLYAVLFATNMASNFHSFLEWCGVLSEHVKMVGDTGIAPHRINTHSGIAVSVPTYRYEYLGEKLNCILAPFLRGAGQEQRKLFIDKLFDGVEGELCTWCNGSGFVQTNRCQDCGGLGRRT